MNPRSLAMLAAVASGVAAAASVAVMLTSGTATTRVEQAPAWQAAPYLYLGADGSLPSVAQVMAATGVRRFTLAFIVSDGTCKPAWDDGDPLAGSTEQAAIRNIRAAGGDAAVAFGGMGGTKLAVTCTSAQALAGAYQQVVDAYRLRAIDLDAEDSEIASATARQRMIGALGILRRDDPGLTISVTLGTEPTGPDDNGRDLIARAAAAGLRVDAWTIMPFDFATRVPDMGRASMQAAEALKTDLMSAYREPASAAYQTMGISSMNGRTDTGEIVGVRDFQSMLRYARAHHLARFTFWSVNRDRSCVSAATSADACSGITQSPYAFTRVVAEYRG